MNGRPRYTFLFGVELVEGWRRVRYRGVEATDWAGLYCAGGEI